MSPTEKIQPKEQRHTFKKRLKVTIPDTYVILFGLMIVCAAATYLVPAGLYKRVESNGLTLVQPGTFHHVANTPVSIGDVFLAYPEGMIETANIFFLVMFIGGAFEIMTRTGAIDAGIKKLVGLLGSRPAVLIIAFGVIFALLCAVGFSANAVMAFIPLGLLLAKAMGLDALSAVGIVFLTSMSGFNTAFLNPKTLGVAQTVAELPMFSGMGYRLILWAIFLIATLAYVIVYARRVKRDPSLSLMGKNRFPSETSEDAGDMSTIPDFSVRHLLVILAFVAGMAFYVYGSLNLDFAVNEMTGVFLAIAILAAIIGRIGANDFVDYFMTGARKLVYGALIIGAARAVVFILENGQILDTVVHSLEGLLAPLSPALAAVGMLLANGVFNFFVPSGSGQALITMPVWTPLADLIGITRQVAVQAFQLGDGFTNSLFPTSGILMASLAIARVKYTTWLKFVWPLMVIWFVLGAIVLVIGVWLNWGPA